jgi:hypothetical protein
MTTIWENDDGTIESGCGCVGHIKNKRFVVTKPCPVHVQTKPADRTDD